MQVIVNKSLKTKENIDTYTHMNMIEKSDSHWQLTFIGMDQQIKKHWARMNIFDNEKNWT